MIVNELELGPFAGITEKMKIVFDNGLNVILGRNEAGKSTFVKALISAFFLQISPGKNSREYKEELKPLFPHPHGDTINVSVRIDCNGETYQLKKTWGENPTVELRLPNGNRISNETRVGEKLDKIMAYGSETYRNILISRQADMARTIESLKSSSEATSTLGEALRRTMFEADGVSVDALKERIKSEVDDLLSNWDIQRDCSRDDKRWKKGVGKVLEAFYRLEDQKKTLIESREAEENYLKISNEFREVVDEIEKLSQEVGGLKSIAGDIQKRKEFEPKLELLRVQEDKLKKANREWPVAEREIASLESSIRELTGQKVKLETELVAANAAIKSQNVRDLFNKVEPIYERVQELEQQTNELPNIRREDLKELGQLVNEVDTCKAKLSASKLSGGFSSKEPMNLIVQEDLDDPKNISVEPGGEVPIKAGSQIIIESKSGWKMELHSGKQDIETIKKSYEESRVKLAHMKSGLKVDLVDEVEQAVKKREETERALELEKGKLKTLLEGKLFESLKDEFNNLGEQKQAGEQEQIRNELRGLDFKQNKLELELKNLSERLEEWKQEHGEHDKVFERLGELNSQRKEVEKEIEKLAPVPDIYENSEAFQKDLEEKERRLQSLRDDGNELKLELAKSEANLSDESTKDIEKALKLYEKEFQDLKNRAKALTSVEAVFNKVVDEMDANPYGPLLESFTCYLAPLTGNRYKHSSMDGPFPSGIMKEGGTEIPIDLLSTGTGDGTAIALRLAMAEHLLQGRKGFMIMDDPLVNLDPERRRAAAGVLRDFAGKFQLIITTCDPNTAHLLSGNLIQI